MKILLSIVVFLLGSNTASAGISIDEFLRQAVVETTAYPSTASLPSDHAGGLNRWFNDAQVRLSDDPNTRSYALRVAPKMPRQISAEKAIVDLRRQQRALSDEAELNDRLLLRYEQWLDLVEQRSRVSALEQARALAEAEVQYHRGLAQTSDFRANALLEAELKLGEQLEQDRLQRDRLVAAQAALDVDMPARGLTSLEEMLRVVTATPVIEVSPGERAASLALDLAEQEARADRARQGWGFDLLQVEVATDTRNNTDSRGFLVGVHVPLGGSSFDSTERAFDVAAASSDLRRRALATQRAAVDRRELLDWRKAEADAINATLVAIEERFQTARQHGDLAVLLAVQWERVKAQQRLAEVHQRALRDYLEYLHLGGRLAQPPLRNWLTPGQQPL